MDRRRQRINEFLKYIANISIYNPDIKITSDLVYGELIRIGLENADRNYQIKDNFGYWIDRFDNKENIKVFNDPKWAYFCQFVNGDISDKRTHIKMYVPLKKEIMARGANMLFDFLADNNIVHKSKIGSNLRNDSIVIRVASFSDANKIAQFIESNEFIKNGLIEANPFMFNDGNIGYATDANLSYSNKFSQYIASYISNLDKNNLQSVNIENFFNFVSEQYNNVFADGNSKDILEYEKQHNLSALPFDKKVYTMANSAEVTKLILCSLAEPNTLDRVAQIYSELMNPAQMQYIEDSIRDNYNKMNNNNNITETITLNTNLDKEKILRNAIYATLEKYGYEHAKKALEKLAIENNNIGITREQGARENVQKHLSGPEVQQIIQTTLGSINFDLYMNRILERKTIEYKETILENACLATLTKYGINQLEGAINRAITGNFSSFTNTNDCRNQLMRNVNKEEIEVLMMDMMKQSGMIGKDNITSEFAKLMQIKLQENQTSKKNNIAL